MGEGKRDGALGMTNKALLLVDLDGVVVFECGAPFADRLEIFRLHKNLPELLGQVDAPVVILTHRSRAEARRILHAAGVATDLVAGIVAAEDLFLAGLRGGLGRMAKHGLRKSLILPAVEAKFDVDRRRVAFIDDRATNLDDLLECGLGLAMLAPSRIGADRKTLHSFDFSEALDAFRQWRASGSPRSLVKLSDRQAELENWQRTGLCTTREGRHAFNVARRVGSIIRRSIHGGY
jgi:FMN phosphatase YigB (HAD superfamily)